MKTVNRLVYALAGLLLIGGAAWATDYKMQATSIDPSAQGSVTAVANKGGGNTTVKVKVEHLGKPTLLTPPANEYVIWIQPQGQAAHNEGTIRIGEDEKGELTMTTTAAQFTVLVTAESDAHPQAPSNRVVLRSAVQE